MEKNASKKIIAEDLTLEEAKQFECCKDLSDEQIIELLNTIKTFCEITFSIYAKEKESQDENQIAA
jgi:hypothetical protein